MYIIKTLGNVIKMLKYPHTQHLLLYKVAEQSNSALGRLLGCWKYNIVVITQALMLCLIYTHSPSGIVHIYQAKHSCLCYNLYIMYTVYTSIPMYGRIKENHWVITKISLGDN